MTQLWWFCDGAIMDPGTRHHLWRSWGLCPRHAWMYFRAENELKYQPLGNAVLHADLCGRAAGLLGAHRRPSWKRRRLATADSCLTCDYLASSPPGRGVFADDLAIVQSGLRTRDWLDSGRDIWLRRRCPSCPMFSTGIAGADPRAPHPDSMPCRRHADERSFERLDAYLDDLTQRLKRVVKSMTADGPPRTPDSDAALVEALGWFAGWPPWRIHGQDPSTAP